MLPKAQNRVYFPSSSATTVAGCNIRRAKYAATAFRVPLNGAILSGTRLHISLEPYFQARLPLTVVSAQLKAGPVLYAFADTNFATGTKVNIEARIDDSGEAVLWAAARPGSGDKS
jgi:hypothetical protein